MSVPIRVIRLTVDGDVEVRTVENSGPALHDLLGGYMEVIYVTDLTADPMNGIIGLVDENGWQTPRPTNPWSPIFYRTVIAGPILLVRAAPDGEFVSLTDSDIERIWAKVGYVTMLTIEA